MYTAVSLILIQISTLENTTGRLTRISRSERIRTMKSPRRLDELFGGIEAGGTKFVCAVGTGPDDIRAEETFPTTTPGETIERCVGFFERHSGLTGEITALGIGSFGPVDPDPRSPTWGYITETPKDKWRHTDFGGRMKAALGIPVAFDTDVNAAAFGEYTWGAAQGIDSFVYLTVGTGVGGGAMVNGELLHGMMHPEMGHIFVRRRSDEEGFKGICRYHRDCLEGLASGAALKERWGVTAEEMEEGHPGLDLEADYLAQALCNYLYILSPRRIILGGGVMGQGLLFPMIRRKMKIFLAGYIPSREVVEGMDSYVVPPLLGKRAGVMGALALARSAAIAL